MFSLCMFIVQVVSGGGSAVEAVEAAVMVLEDNPAFDAGVLVFMCMYNAVGINMKGSLIHK